MFWNNAHLFYCLLPKGSVTIVLRVESGGLVTFIRIIAPVTYYCDVRYDYYSSYGGGFLDQFDIGRFARLFPNTFVTVDHSDARNVSSSVGVQIMFPMMFIGHFGRQGEFLKDDKAIWVGGELSVSFLIRGKGRLPGLANVRCFAFLSVATIDYFLAPSVKETFAANTGGP